MASTTNMTAYDEVAYDTEANAETHPRSLATLGRLCGLEPASVRTARVLEIGCGNGENLISAATYLPEAKLVGFDLSETAIALGRANVERAGLRNVVLRTSDILAHREAPHSFDYVIAHGMYSWVPEPVRAALLSLMHDVLTPTGLGFLSFNALPGWELRGVLRELMRDAVRATASPAEQVEKAMAVVGELGRIKEGTPRALAVAAAARDYEAHVREATPLEAPFSRYVFHDLLAECNDPFSREELAQRLAHAGLRIVCDTPLGSDPKGPFLQVIVQRADAPVAAHEPRPDAMGDDMFLWADFTSEHGGYRTSTGALVQPVRGEGLARAVDYAPGFIAVRELVSEASLPSFQQQLFDAVREGVLTVCVEPPSLGDRLASHVEARIDDARRRRASSVVLTNALHRSFRVSLEDLDDTGRLRRHLFLVERR